MTDFPPHIQTFLEALLHWSTTQPHIQAILLVGSYARAEATPASDLDLVLITSDPSVYIKDAAWITHFGTTSRTQLEAYGLVASLRVFYTSGLEVEFGLATPDWASVPIDPGTQKVLDDGFIILYDPQHSLNHLSA